MAPHPDKPQVYHPKMAPTWWLKNPRYFLFMMRELTSVFIAIFLVVFLIQIFKLSQGPEAYASFLEKLRSPGWIAFHVVALLFALYHSFTWFDLTSKVQIVQLGKRRMPPRLVTAASIGVWVILSLAVLLLFFLL